MKFGVSGNSKSFYDEGHKRTIEAAKWCRDRNIDIFEYSFGRGVNMSVLTAREIKKAFDQENIIITVHAPYYINLSNTSSEMIEKSFGYIIKSIEIAKEMGGSRIIVHPASQGKLNRKEAERIMLDNAKKLTDILDEKKLNDIYICWETMGKKGQMGTVDEIINICNIDDRYIPCIDYGHINAREGGILNNEENYNTLIEKLIENIEFAKIFNMHSHFSKIQFGDKGEIKHLTFEDNVFGPNFEPLIDALIKYKLKPYIICESDGTQAEDCIMMKNYYISRGKVSA